MHTRCVKVPPDFPRLSWYDPVFEVEPIFTPFRQTSIVVAVPRVQASMAALLPFTTARLTVKFEGAPFGARVVAFA
jgi:hypothetical protein